MARSLRITYEGAYFNGKQSSSWLCKKKTLDFFGNKNPSKYYQQFVMEKNNKKPDDFEGFSTTAVILGKDDYVRSMAKDYFKIHKITKEIPRQKILAKPLNIALIKELVSKHYHINIGTLLNPLLKKQKLIKNIAIYLSYKFVNTKLDSIGEAFGNISKAAIKKIIQRIKKKLAVDKKFSEKIKEIEKKLFDPKK